MSEVVLIIKAISQKRLQILFTSACIFENKNIKEAQVLNPSGLYLEFRERCNNVVYNKECREKLNYYLQSTFLGNKGKTQCGPVMN